MKKRVIKLTENQLDKIVKSVLTESYGGIIQIEDDLCEIICKRKIAMYGSNGDVVKMIQHLLYVNQFNTKYSGGGMSGDWCYSDWTKCDGKFKNQTKNAVEEFQSRYGLTVDGKVGYNTWQAICKNLQFSKSLPKGKFCIDCNCDKPYNDSELEDKLGQGDYPILDPIKIIDELDCGKIKDCITKYLYSGTLPPNYEGFMGCLKEKSSMNSKKDCNMCKKVFTTGYINKMPKIGEPSKEQIWLDSLGDWCLTNCDGFKGAY